MSVCALSANGEESWRVIRDQRKNPNSLRKLIDFVPIARRHFPWKYHQKTFVTVWDILHTDTQTHRNITSLAEVMNGNCELIRRRSTSGEGFHSYPSYPLHTHKCQTPLHGHRLRTCYTTSTTCCIWGAGSRWAGEGCGALINTPITRWS